jgi:hypothetical protein
MPESLNRAEAAQEVPAFSSTPIIPALEFGLRGALFARIASFILPRRAMPRKVMSLDITRPGAVVEGRA